MTDSTTARTGRRTGESTAREDILAAAAELFASGGFAGTTLRAVAARAGVDVALIPYYFTNKRGLFVAAMALPVDPAEHIARASVGPREQLGERLVTQFLALWDSEANGPALQGVLRSAMADDPAAQIFGEFSSQVMLPLVAEEAGLNDDTVRVLVSMLFGMATMRYLIGSPAFTEPSDDELVAIFAPRVQALIDAD